MRHLRTIDDLGVDGIQRVLDLARDANSLPSLRGRAVASLFFESSTRTRLSFETAARRLSAEVLSLAPGVSSANKGESLRDTLLTVEAMGADVLVVRHARAGVPGRAAAWTSATVVNAGDGAHEHPTQALVDLFTLVTRLQISQGRGLEGLRIAIVGDVAHSRVARSGVRAFTALGAQVTLVGPPTLLPPGLETWPVEVAYELDEVLPKVDVVYLLRLQEERMQGALLPGRREYRARYGMTRERVARLGGDALVMHPGPMVRGLEIADEVAEDPRCVAREQAVHGVAVRMAVLSYLLEGGTGGRGV